MPKKPETKKPLTPLTRAEQVAFLADRMALLMVELVHRDFDYGRFCHEAMFVGEVPDFLRKSKEYDTCLDFVRIMMRKQHNGASDAKAETVD